MDSTPEIYIDTIIFDKFPMHDYVQLFYAVTILGFAMLAVLFLSLMLIRLVTTRRMDVRLLILGLLSALSSGIGWVVYLIPEWQNFGSICFDYCVEGQFYTTTMVFSTMLMSFVLIVWVITAGVMFKKKQGRLKFVAAAIAGLSLIAAVLPAVIYFADGILS